MAGAACAVALVAVSDIVPLLYMVRLSLAKVGGGVGGAYAAVLRDHVFIRSLLNTALFAVGAATAQVGAGLVIALALRPLSRAACMAWFAVLLAPWLMSEVASVVLWRGVLMADVGHLDRWMGAFGLPALRMLAGAHTALPALIVVATWQGIGFTALVILGALVALPANLYGAAMICGLNRWATFLRLELPHLKPTLFAVWVAVALHSAGQFALPARLTMGGPMHATSMASIYLFDRLLHDPTPAMAAAGGAIVLAGLATACVAAWCLRRVTGAHP
ncbi:MAG: sugar ABC transporter permease [Candidatus Eisenbacteria bacterium]|nr:sugar ABC transporter permease [Candidatus Eisenbacteria bacterium]